MIIINPVKGTNLENFDTDRININFNFSKYLKEYMEKQGDTVLLTRNTASSKVGNIDSLVSQYKPTVFISIDCYASIDTSFSGYNIVCDHYTALVATWVYEFYRLGRNPVKDLGYSVDKTCNRGSVQDITIYLGHISNSLDREWLLNDDNLKELAIRLVDAAYGPPLYSTQDNDPCHLEDPYFYSSLAWKESGSITGASAIVSKTKYAGNPVRYLELKNTTTNTYSWEIPLDFITTTSCFFIASVKTDHPCTSWVKVGSQEYETYVEGEDFHTLILDVEATVNSTLKVGIKGKGTLAYTGIWVSPKGTLGTFDDPRVKYSIFPPGYRVDSKESTITDGGITACLTSATSLIERVQDDRSTVLEVTTTKSNAYSVQESSSDSTITGSSSVGTSSKSSSSKSKSNTLATIVGASVAAVAVSSLIKNSSKISNLLSGDNTTTNTQNINSQLGKDITETDISTGEEKVTEKAEGSAIDKATAINEQIQNTTDIGKAQVLGKIARHLESQGIAAEKQEEADKDSEDNYAKSLAVSSEDIVSEIQAVSDKNNIITSALKGLNFSDIKSSVLSNQAAVNKSNAKLSASLGITSGVTNAKALKEEFTATKAEQTAISNEKATAIATSTSPGGEYYTANSNLVKEQAAYDVWSASNGVEDDPEYEVISSSYPNIAAYNQAKKDFESAQSKLNTLKSEKSAADAEVTKYSNYLSKPEFEAAINSQNTHEQKSESINSSISNTTMNPDVKVGSAVNALKEEQQKIDAKVASPAAKARKNYLKKLVSVVSPSISENTSGKNEAIKLLKWLYTGLTSDTTKEAVAKSEFTPYAQATGNSGVFLIGFTSYNKNTSSEELFNPDVCKNRMFVLYRVVVGNSNPLKESTVIRRVPESILYTAYNNFALKKAGKDMRKIWKKGNDACNRNIMSASFISMLTEYGLFGPKSLSKIYSDNYLLNLGFESNKGVIHYPDEYNITYNVSDSFLAKAKDSYTLAELPGLMSTLSGALDPAEIGNEHLDTDYNNYPQIGYIWSGDSYKSLFKLNADIPAYEPCTQEETTTFLTTKKYQGNSYEELSAPTTIKDIYIKVKSRSFDIHLCDKVDLSKTIPVDIVIQIEDTKEIPEDYKITMKEQRARVQKSAYTSTIVENASKLGTSAEEINNALNEAQEKIKANTEKLNKLTTSVNNAVTKATSSISNAVGTVLAVAATAKSLVASTTASIVGAATNAINKGVTAASTAISNSIKNATSSNTKR